MNSLLAAIVLAGCAHQSQLGQVGVPWVQSPIDSRRVLVVMNLNSDVSREIGEFYVAKRKIPSSNVMYVNLGKADEMARDEYLIGLEEPVRKKIKQLPAPPDFIVLAKGIPIRFKERPGYSVDAFLGAMDLKFDPITEPKDDQIRKSVNPYFGKDEPFTSRKYGFYLVTRLDGYDALDAKKLVLNSFNAKPLKGPFLIDVDPSKNGGGYLEMHRSLENAGKLLRAKNMEVVEDDSKEFVGCSRPVSGYASWGSNDQSFKLETYRGIEFQPGALAETFVSTSGRTFTKTTGGQSLIADLIENGVTGVKGYVSEPYTFALAHPDILFDRYTKGYTLAESFAMASRLLKWKDVVVGDPICRPYLQRIGKGPLVPPARN